MMDANDARRMTDEALGEDAEAVRPYVEHVEARVRDAAGRGRAMIAHPFSGMRDPPPREVGAAVRRAMEARGFKWTDHPNPDPGHPAAGPYTTVSW